MKWIRVGLAGLFVLSYIGAAAAYAAKGLGALSGLSAAWWLLPTAVVLGTRARSALLPVAVLGLTEAGVLSWWQAVLVLLPAAGAIALMHWLGGAVEACRKIHRAWSGLL